VHLISDTLYYHLIGSFPTFLRKQLLDEGSGIDAITMPGLSVRWQGERWQLEPEPQNYSGDQVTRLLDEWRLASALEIKPYDGQPGEAISIEISGSEAPLDLLVTSRQPDLILARPGLGIQYHLAAASGARLLQLPGPDDALAEEQEEAPSANGHDH
jgi:hypothetical protein